MTSNQKINAYLHQEHSCQISSRSDLKRWSLRLFEEVTQARTTRKTRTKY